MKENPYQVSGASIATLRGRRGDWSRLLRHLEKPTPDHVSVVGPRCIGKTVLLNAIATYFASGHNPFNACAYWDMRHGAPDSDAEFYRVFAQQLIGPVKCIDPGVGEVFAGTGGGTFETLRLVFETLAEERKKVLVVFDGMDGVLLAGALTRNLWDSLRALAEFSSLRFVTGSRHRLRELCASPESKTSDFWNIFAPNPLSLGTLKDDDWNDLLAPFQEQTVSFLPGARTELANWSGGVPVLASLLCRRLWEEVKEDETVTNEQVNSVATVLLGDASDYLDELWSDCTEEERGDLAELAQGRALKANDLPQQRSRMLMQRGFIREKGGSLICSCRFMEHYAREHGARSTELRRLFGDSKSFDANIKGLLGLRFGQLDRVDEEMIDFIRLAIQSIDKPHFVLMPIRGLVNRAFKLIWDSELPGGRIPEEWTESWKNPDKEGNRGEFDPPKGVVPSQGGRQCYLLNLLTDSRKEGTTKVSRATYFLLDYLQSIGDFGQHRQGEEISLRFGAAVCFAAVELCEQLASELRA